MIDLVHVTDETVKIVDFKTDRSRYAESEYRIQLSVYYPVLNEWFSDRTVTTSLFYTAEDDQAAVRVRASEVS